VPEDVLAKLRSRKEIDSAKALVFNID
jgi:hypothetical protein